MIFNPLTSYFLICPCRRICSNKTNVPADLHELLSAAKNLPELSIRIFNPLASYCYLIGMNCGSQFLIFHAVGFFAALNNTCISDSTLLLWLIVPTENITLVALRQRYAATRPNNSGTYSKKLTDMT